MATSVPELGISAAQVREIAAKAECDPRTVVKWFRREKILGLPALRIERIAKRERFERP